jgi:Flavin containing amine oxidoreductase
MKAAPALKAEGSDEYRLSFHNICTPAAFSAMKSICATVFASSLWTALAVLNVKQGLVQATECGRADVVIVGAGFSGLAAAKELKAKGVNFRIVESTSRVGGRVSSVQPADFGGLWVEEGANWVYKFDGNPIYDMALERGLKMTLNNGRDAKLFEFDGSNVVSIRVRYNELGSISPSCALLTCSYVVVQAKKAKRLNMDSPNQRWTDMDRAIRCLGRESEGLYEDEPIPDEGAIKVLGRNCSWIAASGVDRAIQWNYLDYEFTMKDTSLYNFPYSEFLLGRAQEYFVGEQNGGYESLAVGFATDEGLLPSYIDFNKRVANINYDYAGNPNYKVKIDITGSTCTHYLAKYVILTVPVGVLEHQLITFQPPLYTEDVPQTMGQYTKIFYKFNFRVGPKYKNEFLFALLEGSTTGDNDERCMHWQNMDAKRNNIRGGTSTDYLPNSHIWMCTLTTQAFNKILATGDGQHLSADQLDTLLNPLRQIFHEQSITRSDYKTFYPDLNLRDDFGRGAFSDWKIGTTVRQFYEFYGGGGLIEPCEHNGCDSSRKWRLHISGTGSCLEEFEFIHGAYFAGQRSALNVLAEMGQAVDIEGFTSCEDWGDYELPPAVVRK